jgi:glycosyltransferase involved in cell wall biosynthesis
MSGRKKILVVTSRLPFEEGGNTTIARVLSNKLQKLGYDSAYIEVPQNRFGKQASAYIAARFTSVKRTYIDEEIDQVISFRFPSFAVKHDKHVCWINHRMREYYDLWDNFYSSIQSPLDRIKEKTRRCIIHAVDKYLLTKNVDKLFAQSKNIQSRLCKFGNIKSEVLYPPALGTFEYRCESYDNYIFSPSRLNPLKRNSLLIKAISHLKNIDIKCYIVGDGAEKDNLVKLVNELGLNDKVIFLGYLDSDKLSSYFSNALAIFFGPLDEDYGLVTLEAMMCQKPVLTCSDSGGPTEFVTDNVNGYITSPDPESIAHKISILYNDKSKAESLGNSGFELAKTITWDKTIERLILV